MSVVWLICGEGEELSRMIFEFLICLKLLFCNKKYYGLLLYCKKFKIKVVLLICFSLMSTFDSFSGLLQFFKARLLPWVLGRKYDFKLFMLKFNINGLSEKNLVRRSAGNDIYTIVLGDGSKVWTGIYEKRVL